MFFINKLLLQIRNNPLIFKDPDINFLTGLTTRQIKDLKKAALQEGFIIQKKKEYFLTNKGEKYLKDNPLQSWKSKKYPKRPDLNLEYLKTDKPPAIVTKAIRNLTKHLLDGTPLKLNSMEDYIQRELLSSESKFRQFECELEEIFKENKRINILNIYNKFSSDGLTKPIISVLLLSVLARNKDIFAVYEKYQFQLIINQLLFDKMIFYPENFELQKTTFEHSSILEEISQSLLPNRTNNSLEIAKGLISFIRRLDNYTLKTERLSKKAIRFRNTILNAKDPINLLTIDIPKIIQNRKLKDCDNNFIVEFNEVINNLQKATNNMISEINEFTLNAFNSTNRKELSDRFISVEEFIGAKDLKILYKNIVDSEVSDKFWIERIATFTNKSRVPKDWSDEDVADFKVKIKEMALKFKLIEATVGTNQNVVTADFKMVFNNFLKLTKAEQLTLLRKAANW